MTGKWQDVTSLSPNFLNKKFQKILESEIAKKWTDITFSGESEFIPVHANIIDCINEQNVGQIKETYFMGKPVTMDFSDKVPH